MAKAPGSHVMAKPRRRTLTNETVAFMRGLYGEYENQFKRYTDQIAHLFEIEARVEIIEKNLCVSRDHLAMAMKNAEDKPPKEWRDRLQLSRFVGSRLADACMIVLRERRQITHEELVDALNLGGYRFRTTSPAREIHGALLRQPKSVRRIDGGWEWIGEQTALPLRLVHNPEMIQREQG